MVDGSTSPRTWVSGPQARPRPINKRGDFRLDVTLEMYRRCEKAFLREIVVTANIVLGKQPELSSDDRKRILKDLVFGLSTHLDNSSYSGEVDGVMVYPILWYDLGELEGSVRLKGSAALHEIAGEIVDQVLQAESDG